MPSPENPSLGEHGEPCRQCGAPLAGDQRYCLNCGNRRGGPRLDFESILGGGQGEPAMAGGANQVVATSAPASSQREIGPIAAVGAVAALGAILLIGVLIGKGNNSGTGTAAAPVVHVNSGTGTSTTASTTAGDGAAATASASFTSDWPSGKTGYTVELGTLPKQSTSAGQVDAQKQALQAKGASDVGALDSDQYGSLPSGNYIVYSGVYSTKAEADKALAKLKPNFPNATVVKVAKSSGAGAAAAAAAVPAGAKKVNSLTSPGNNKGPVVATDKALKDLSGKTGAAYEQAQKNLPDVIATPGKPPPTDNKAPGGGSGGGVTIK